MENTTNTYPDELQHWGIKGMKWGIRRFQNKDGSLTPAGRKRYDDDGDSSKSSEHPKKAPHEMTGKDYKKMKIEDMTDEELARAINRSRAEQVYSQLNPEPVSKGKVLAEKFLNEALIPVAVNAGKNFMDKQMNKIIDKALADNTPKSALDKLKDEAATLKVKEEIAKYKDSISKIGKDTKSELDKVTEEYNLAKKKQELEELQNGGSEYSKKKAEYDMAKLQKDIDKINEPEYDNSAYESLKRRYDLAKLQKDMDDLNKPKEESASEKKKRLQDEVDVEKLEDANYQSTKKKAELAKMQQEINKIGDKNIKDPDNDSAKDLGKQTIEDLLDDDGWLIVE